MEFLFSSFGLKDFIDILLVTIILYQIYYVLRKSGVANLFWGILAFILVWFIVTYVFGLELTGALFDRIISVGAIALIVIFQEEIRAFFYRLGTRFLSVKLFRRQRMNNDAIEQQVVEIANACRHMSATKTGALIVLTGDNDLKQINET